MYHKNKSLCFYVSQVSLKSFLGSERQGGSTGYATAVDFRSLQFHNKIASLAVAAHTLEPLLVEYLAEGDIVVGQRTETAGVHGNEGLVHRFCL